MSENPQQYSANGPRRGRREPECGANAGSPERAERMDDQPIDRNRKLKEEDKSGNRAEETHSIRFLNFLLKPCMQRRIPDQAQNQCRAPEYEPGPLRPPLVRAPQAPTRHSRARRNVEKTRHARDIRFRWHLLTSLVLDISRFWRFNASILAFRIQ